MNDTICTLHFCKFCFVLLCAFALINLCACGGGGGGSIATNDISIQTTSKDSIASVDDRPYYGYGPDDVVVIPDGAVGKPAFTNDNGTPSFDYKFDFDPATNASAGGGDIYSEALTKRGFKQIDLTLTINGKTEQHTITSADALVLKNVPTGTVISVSGTVTLLDGSTKPIMPKTTVTEYNQTALPLFVGYTANFARSDARPTDSPFGDFLYSSDKPIQLPDVKQIGSFPFVGFQVSAPGLSIDGNYYPKGTNIPLAELTGDVTFLIDVGFTVSTIQGQSNTQITNDGFTIKKDDGVSLSFSKLGETAVVYGDINAVIANPSIANWDTNYTSGSAFRLVGKSVGTTTVTFMGKSKLGKSYSFTVPITVTP